MGKNKMKNKELVIDEEFSSLIPPLSSEEFEGLKDSVVSEGCRDPLVVWDNILLDGHNRYRICMENNLLFSRVEKNFESREQAKVWILENQLGRRNINAAQRIDLVDKLFGLKEKQDAKERQGTRTDKLGGKFSTKSRDNLGNKAKVSGKTYDKGIKIKKEAPELWQECLDGKKSIDGALEDLKKRQKEKEKEEKRNQKSLEGSKIVLSNKDIDFRFGDFREVLQDVPDGSVDLIITDPPYPIEFIDEWEKLGEFAKKKLKKNGYLVAYCGHKNLFESMDFLNQNLDFYWIFALIHTGNTKLVKFNNIDASWKPILVYQNGYKKIGFKIKDVVEGTGRDKENHEWGQSDNELSYLINNFSKPGDLIVDPFAGGGTTLVIANKNNRRCIGAEKDKDTFNIAKKRINDEF